MNHDTSAPIALVLQLVLREAFRTENLARGASRRGAFQTTRYLLGGCRTLGISAAQLATALDRSTSAIALRSGIDGPITTADFARLAHLSPEVVDDWRQDGILNAANREGLQADSYPASHLIRALLTARTSERRSADHRKIRIATVVGLRQPLPVPPSR